MCAISRYVGAQDRWDVLKAWLRGDGLGAGFLLKVVLLGDESTVNRSEGEFPTLSPALLHDLHTLRNSLAPLTDWKCAVLT